MATATIKAANGSAQRDRALGACADALKQVANYRLPPALERKLRRMLDAKESLTPRERRELLALVELAQVKSLEMVKARVALDLLAAAFPYLKA
jgi:hypothetical protein